MSARNLRNKFKYSAAQSIRIDINSKQSVVKSLESKVVELFDKAEELPVTLSRQNGNVEVRTKVEGEEGRMISLCEFKEIDNLVPDDFLVFLDNFSKIFPKVHDLVSSAKVIKPEVGRDGIKALLDMPFPMSPRIMFYYKYLLKNRSPDEHMLILSEVENEELIEEFFDEEEKDDYVLGRTFLSVYWIMPMKDESGKVTGSHIKYIWCGDMCGLIPKWIQDSGSPKTSLDAIKRLVEYITERKANGGKDPDDSDDEDD